MMIAGRLRRAVLQAAISGQLTEQRTADGDARDLLAAIRAEKARRVRAGELKKARPLPPITPEEQPFALPANWCWARFSDVAIISTNLVSPDEYQEVFQIAPDLIEKGTGRLLGKRTVREFATKSKNHSFFKGQLLYSKIRPALRKAVIAPYDGLCSADMYPLTSMIDVSYLLTLLLSDIFTEQVTKKANRVKMPKVNQSELSAVLLPVPPLPEQKRIVDKIGQVIPELSKLEADERQLEALATAFPGRLQASLLQAAISGRLTERQAGDGDARDLLADIQRERQRLVREKKLKKEKPLPPVTDEEVPFELPENWCWCRFSDIFQVARGGSPRPIKQYLTDAPNGINWIKIGDTDIGGKYILTTRERIIPEGVKHSRMVHSGDLLLTNSMSYGRPYILKTDGCIHDGWLVLSPFSDGIDKDFFFYLISAPYIQRAFINLVAGGVVKNLNKDRVKQILLPLPPLVEQKRIVARLEELLPLCGELEQG